MHGKSKATTHEQYIAEVEERRRPDLQRLHELVREGDTWLIVSGL